MKKFTNFFRNNDNLAKPILLNFNRKETHFKTIIGGCTSVLLKIAIMLFMGFRIFNMVMK